MIETILNTLSKETTQELTNTFNLSDVEVNKVIGITGSTVTDIVKNQSTNQALSGVLNLFSTEENNTTANTLLNTISTSLTKNITSGLGIDNTKSTEITSYILPIITKLLTDKIGGSNTGLSSIFGGESLIKDIAGDILKKKISSLFN